MRITHYDIDSLNGTVFIYGYDNTTHSKDCTQPLLTPDPTNVTSSFLYENLQFCSNADPSSNRSVEYINYVRGRNEDLDNLLDGRDVFENGTTSASVATNVVSVYVINVFLSSVLFFNLLSYFVNNIQWIK